MSSPPTPLVPRDASDDEIVFPLFVDAVAHRQLAEWLPAEPQRILDLSLNRPRLLALMIDRGHTVVHAQPGARPPDIRPAAEPTGMIAVRADTRRLDWLADGCIDAVVAEGGVLSSALAAELTLEDLHRVLRPGGRVLLCVDSLVAGLARLADQGRWLELADVPAADVVLVPGTDGTVSRCFWPEELHGMLTAAGFDVEWIRPRTVLAEQTVTRALSLDPGQLDSLVSTELALSVRRQGESIGGCLVASARRRPD